MSETASAPPAAAALAIAAMSVTLGVSLARIGSEHARRAPATTRSHIRGSVPKSTPWLTFGQEMFSSIAAIPANAFQAGRHGRRTRRTSGRRC